jgi:hypothetical protein
MAIQQHPIPQNVTTYQFRLVGDMTLKQFLQLAGGIVVGLLFYASPLPFFLKWPLVGLAVGLGAGMAFLPVQGRPMDQWLMSFFRSIYQPTIFTWTKSTVPVVITPTRPVTPTPPPIGGTVQPGPSLTMGRPTTGPMATYTAPSVSFSGSALAGSVPTIQTQTPAPAAGEPESTGPKKIIVTRQEVPIRIEAQPKPQAPQAVGPRPQVVSQVPTTTAAAQMQPSTSTPVFSSNLPIPSTPQTPNIVVGMTLTPDGKILEGAIVEVRLQGATVRATKSNKLGQFMFLKPLDNGTYQLTAERDGFTFPTFSLMAAGAVIWPIKLQATTAVPIAASATPVLARAPFTPPINIPAPVPTATV